MATLPVSIAGLNKLYAFGCRDMESKSMHLMLASPVCHSAQSLTGGTQVSLCMQTLSISSQASACLPGSAQAVMYCISMQPAQTYTSSLIMVLCIQSLTCTFLCSCSAQAGDSSGVQNHDTQASPVGQQCRR